MPGLYSISSLIRMTDKCGSTNFRLGGGGGGGGARQNVTENGLVSFLVLNLPTVGSMSSTYLQWDQCQFQRELYFLDPKAVQHFPEVESNSIAYYLYRDYIDN